MSGNAAAGRLSLAGLAQAGRPQADVTGPAVDPRALSIGLVHLGIGAFHRAHQAVYTELAAAATGSTEWGISASTQRSAAVRDQLDPQDGLYTVLERGPGAGPLRVVGSIREVVDGGAAAQDVVARIADPGVRVVTLTVTEKGYRRDRAGRLDAGDPLVAADLAGGAPRTAIGRLVRGLQHRAGADAGPVTVLSCDNLTGNGAAVRALVTDFAERLPEPQSSRLLPWLESSVRFPSCMVDRIVPATTAADRAEVLARLRLEDQGTVVAEPFSQWVIEDDFAAARPPWELAGAVFAADVAPWERVKLRMLNASHSTLAYLGALRGHRTIAEALADAVLADTVRSLMEQDVVPTLQAPDGLDLRAYGEEVLERFANPALRHTTAQVAADGSQKLPLRLLGTVRERLAAGEMPRWATLSVAGWMAFVATRCGGGDDGPGLDDPLAAELGAALAGADSPATVVDRLLGVRAVFGEDLPEQRPWRDELVSAVRELEPLRARVES